MSIVRMQKLTLLCRTADAAASLEALRELGVLHVRPMATPSGADVEAARAKVETLKRVLDAVPADAKVAQASVPSAQALADELSALLDERQSLADAVEKIDGELHRMAPFGAFDPADIQALAGQGVTLKLFRAPLKETPDLPEGVAAQLLSSEKADGYWAAFGKGDFAWAGAEEVRLPEKGTDALLKEKAAIESRRSACEERLVAAAASSEALAAYVAEAEAALRFEEVRAGMGDGEGIVSAVQGFLPEADVEKVRSAAAANGWGIMVEEPSSDDDVPVKLKQPAWARPIQAVFDGINILPGYQEADISMVFMLFFSLFFAMIIGDAGYGLIFLALTLVFWKKMPSNARNLLAITSGATIVWGLVSGSVFGLSHSILEKFGLDKCWLSFLTDEQYAAQNIMGMCFLIGAVQISIGHLWNAFDLIGQKSLKALEQIGWTLTTWYMFFLADNMIIGGRMAGFIGSPAALVPFSGGALDIAAIVGMALILLFMMKPSEIKEGWFNLALFPLNIISNFTDVVSYVRLYAVGAAGFAVANAFNTMIFGGEVTVVGALVGALLAFLAHTLNILLCVMGVLVHGIRLNTLEFSNHKGISWSGSPYRPFAKAN